MIIFPVGDAGSCEGGEMIIFQSISTHILKVSRMKRAIITKPRIKIVIRNISVRPAIILVTAMLSRTTLILKLASTVCKE